METEVKEISINGTAYVPKNSQPEMRRENSMDWKPWETFKTNPHDLLGVIAPPCPDCKHWKPQAKFMDLPTGQIFDGVVCCHAPDMYPDFSCFRSERESEARR